MVFLSLGKKQDQRTRKVLGIFFNLIVEDCISIVSLAFIQMLSNLISQASSQVLSLRAIFLLKHSIVVVVGQHPIRIHYRSIPNQQKRNSNCVNENGSLRALFFHNIRRQHSKFRDFQRIHVVESMVSSAGLSLL